MFSGTAHQVRQHQLYEANARLLLGRLSKKYHRALTLSAVPAQEWRSLVGLGFDLVWLMGVWQRSRGARRHALMHSGLREEYDRALPGWAERDVAGSPYAVYAYNLDPALGADREIARLKSTLNGSGLRLIVDFVPNHVALDHPWVFIHPSWFVGVSEAEYRQHPDRYFCPREGVYLAHGRDPNFPPWTDTAQVNIYSREMREALIRVLLKIASLADGVRCDMAMLVLNEVFERVWGRNLQGYPRPGTEFWTEAIARVKQRRPDFLFIGETYWGYETRLLQLGFDYTYDKELYDRLRFSDATGIRSCLAGSEYLPRLVHFTENHDEPRAVVALGRERSLAAAVIIGSVPGLRLIHDGQLEGRQVRLPVQLIRDPDEPPDIGIRDFYERLLKITGEPVFKTGSWQVLEMTPAWPGNQSYENLLVWSRTSGPELRIIAVNYSASPAQGWLKRPIGPDASETITFADELNQKTYLRDRAELLEKGLYIALDAYQVHIFRVTA